MDRHLRDAFQPLVKRPPRSWPRVVMTALPFAVYFSLYRFKLLLQHGPKTGLLKTPEFLLAFPVLLAYGMMNVAVVAGMAFFPSALKRWMTYQFGTHWMAAQGLDKPYRLLPVRLKPSSWSMFLALWAQSC